MASKSKVRRNLIVGLSAAAVLALALMFAPRPVPVDVAKVTRGPIAETVYDQGQARVRDAYVAAAPVAGRLQRIALKVGDPVTAGEAVARISPGAPMLLDPATLAERRAAVGKAQADLAKAQDEARRTASVAERTQPLVATGAASRQSLDDARAAAAQSRAAEQAAQKALAQARAALIGPNAAAGPGVTVISPAAGYVTRVIEPSAREVAAGSPLIEISDPKGLEAVIEFLSEDAARIRQGMPAEVYDWGGPDVLAARVRRVEPQAFTKVSALGVEEQRVLVWLTLTDPPARWASLGPGYRVWGRVFLRTDPAGLTVPLGALQRHAGAWAIFRIEEGRARLRPITVGAMTDKDAEVLRGLSQGDQVVVFPSDAVKDGVRVAARK